jgi:ABC-type glutathione transport system ATPase component
MPSPSEFVLEARGLSKSYTQGRLWQKRFHHRALDDVSFTLRPGRTMALIGESGSGKTTLAMCLVGLEKPDAGEIFFEGKNLRSLNKSERIAATSEIQLVFQDSAGALNRRMSAIEIVEEPLLLRGKLNRPDRRGLCEEMMERVGLSSRWKLRMPNEFSGGQRQRLAIARALTLQPKVLILDEVFVGLDLSMQGQIANLLLDLQQAHGLSYISISHNLSLASQIADTIAVMASGRITKIQSPDQLLRSSRPVEVASIQTQKASAFRAGSGA